MIRCGNERSGNDKMMISIKEQKNLQESQSGSVGSQSWSKSSFNEFCNFFVFQFSFFLQNFFLNFRLLPNCKVFLMNFFIFLMSAALLLNTDPQKCKTVFEGYGRLEQNEKVKKWKNWKMTNKFHRIKLN